MSQTKDSALASLLPSPWYAGVAARVAYDIDPTERFCMGKPLGDGYCYTCCNFHKPRK